MSISLIATIEYTFMDNMTMSFGRVYPGASHSNILKTLGHPHGGEGRKAVTTRGFPMKNGETDLGWAAAGALTLLAVKDDEGQDRWDEGDSTCVSFKRAQEYIKTFKCKVLPGYSVDSKGKVKPDAEYYHLTDPDVHYPNWITADELEFAIEKASNGGEYGFMAGYHAIVAAMRALEAEKTNSKVRLVYAFDQS